MAVMIMNMMPMTIRVIRVMRLSSMTPMRSDDPVAAGIAVHAAVEVHVPGLNARAKIEMTFEAPADSNRADWAELAYERALIMLDPA